ncbi:hypothetical protein ACR79N_16075 [Sphingobacterium siyangense]
MDKLFRQVKTSERMPTEYKRYETNIGNVHFLAFFRHNIDWWLEKVELPSEEDINNSLINSKRHITTYSLYQNGYEDGVNYILNILKGEKR